VGEADLSLILSIVLSLARQPQSYPWSLTDASLALHCAMAVFSPSLSVESEGGGEVAVSSTRSHPSSELILRLCQLLCALVDHRINLLTSALSTCLTLIRRVLLHTLHHHHHQQHHSDRVVSMLCRVVVHLCSSDVSGMLSHYLPYLLHDVLHVLRHHPDSARLSITLQPAIASCLSLLRDHDLTALHLTLPPPEKELFKRQMTLYKKEWQYKGE
jgi:hypothetical protein